MNPEAETVVLEKENFSDENEINMSLEKYNHALSED